MQLEDGLKETIAYFRKLAERIGERIGAAAPRGHSRLDVQGRLALVGASMASTASMAVMSSRSRRRVTTHSIPFKRTRVTARQIYVFAHAPHAGLCRRARRCTPWRRLPDVDHVERARTRDLRGS